MASRSRPVPEDDVLEISDDSTDEDYVLETDEDDAMDEDADEAMDGGGEGEGEADGEDGGIGADEDNGMQEAEDAGTDAKDAGIGADAEAEYDLYDLFDADFPICLEACKTPAHSQRVGESQHAPQGSQRARPNSQRAAAPQQRTQLSSQRTDNKTSKSGTTVKPSSRAARPADQRSSNATQGKNVQPNKADTSRPGGERIYEASDAGGKRTSGPSSRTALAGPSRQKNPQPAANAQAPRRASSSNASAPQSDLEMDEDDMQTKSKLFAIPTREKMPQLDFGHKPRAGPSTAPSPALPLHQDVFSATQLVPHDAEAWRAPSFQQKNNLMSAPTDKGKRRALVPGAGPPQSISGSLKKRARKEGHAGTEARPANRLKRKREDAGGPLESLYKDFDMMDRDAEEGKYANSWLTWGEVSEILLFVGRRREARRLAAEEEKEVVRLATTLSRARSD